MVHRGRIPKFFHQVLTYFTRPFGGFFRRGRERRIHMDYAAATPVAPEVFASMVPYFSEAWANPGAVYREGVRARKVITEHREDLARMLRIRASGIVFTSGGTESNNLAILGTIAACRKKGKRYEDLEIISLPTEHPSILATLAHLATQGVSIIFAPVGGDGRVDMAAFEKLLSERTVLVTCAYVNSEIGVIQDLKRIKRTIRTFEERLERGVHESILFHTDASQAPLWLPIALDMLGVDIVTFDAGKCYGPKGVGVLAFRHGVTLEPVLFGGGQENGLRSTTENTPLIVGCVRALLRANASWETRSARVKSFRDTLWSELERAIPGVVMNGHDSHRVANNTNISIPDIDTEYAVITLDRHGVCAATRSACGAQDTTGSHVVRAIGGDSDRARTTLRFTLGEETTQSEITEVVRILREHVEKMRLFQNTLGQGAKE